MSEIKTVGQLKNLIKNLSDDFNIELKIVTKLSEDELKELSYPYPYDVECCTLEFYDIGHSDKILIFGCEPDSDH